MGRRFAVLYKGQPAYFKGRKHTEEAKQKNRIAHLRPNGISRANPREYYNLKGLERYARLKGAAGKFTLEEWEETKKRHEYSCAICKSTDRFLTKDHIIPLTKGGSNYIGNIQPLCQSCNSRKGNRLPVST